MIIVVAIIGLLAAVAIASLSTVLPRARDAKRSADLKTLSNALELYFTSNNIYPTWVGGGCTGDPNNPLSTALIPTFIGSLPTDPLSNQYCYHYISNSDGTLYKLAAYMERNTTLAQNDGGSDSTYFEIYNMSGSTQMKLFLDNCVAHWTFDEGSGTTVKDSSGKGNTGTLSGGTLPTWQSGSSCVDTSGSCLGFSNGYVNLPALSTILAPYSVSVWVYPTALGGSTFVSLRGGQTYPGFILYSGNKKLLSYCGSEKYRYGNKVFASGDLNMWWHIVFVVADGTSLTNWKVYLDGIDDTGVSGGNTGTYYNPSSYGSIGSSSVPGGGQFKGTIDDVRIYNTALSACQICELCRNYWTQAQCSNCTNCSGG